MNLLTFLYETDSSFQGLPGMVMWRKSLPASFCLSRYAPPLPRPVRHAGNGNKSLFSAGFIIPGDVRAVTSVELCSSKWMTPTRRGAAASSGGVQVSRGLVHK
ncbi:hypothetical protein CHARACLAT_027463 [Characodon lateralis]|uniref:Uncharacterized protein n=1 Tax=Characodon lateralis TaxID=208331 RepID=A0ABU7EYE5_9TELE|nr:hypothetical protein [Characodon lateralis]